MSRQRWSSLVGLAGAVSMTVAGAGVLGAPAATAEQRDPAPWPVVAATATSYQLDGFELTYLPDGLDRYGVHASTVTDQMGNRTSQVAWVHGPGVVYARVTIHRAERLRTLDTVRDVHYAHLDPGTLERVHVGDHHGYLSPDSGNLFWLTEPGVAVTVFLLPEAWSSEELAALAEGVRAPDVPTADEPDGEDKEEPDDATEETDETDEDPANDGVDGVEDEPAPGDDPTAAEEPAEPDPGTDAEFGGEAPAQPETDGPEEPDAADPEPVPAEEPTEEPEPVEELTIEEAFEMCVAEAMDTTGVAARPGDHGATDDEVEQAIVECINELDLLRAPAGLADTDWENWADGEDADVTTYLATLWEKLPWR